MLSISAVLAVYSSSLNSPTLLAAHESTLDVTFPSIINEEPIPPMKLPIILIAALLIISLIIIGNLTPNFTIERPIFANTPTILPNNEGFSSITFPSASVCTAFVFSKLLGANKLVILSGIDDKNSDTLSGKELTNSSIPSIVLSIVLLNESNPLLAASAPPKALTNPNPPPSKPPINVPPGIGNKAPIIAPVDA